MEHPHIWGLTEWKPIVLGDLAQVWEARQTLLARLVAVKVYQRDLADGDDGAFAREADAIGRLCDHPGIVTAYNAGVLPDSRPYLVTELCPGGSLTQRLDPVNRPAEEQVRSIGIRIADALAAVHACGLVHRDVKPANILFDSFDHPRLADFGLAVEVGTKPTAADMSRVTPAYAPPEAFGREPIAEAAGDVFSLAATLYALLAGRPPRRVDPAVGHDQILEVATRPVGSQSGVNWFLMEVLTTALSYDPAVRPTAAGFRDQLFEVPGSRTLRRLPRIAAADRVPLALVRQDSAPTGQPPVSKPRRAASGTRPSAEQERPPRRAAVSDHPRERRSRRAGFLVLAATLVTVAVSGVAWVMADPAPSGAPAAITQAVAPAGSSARDDSARPAGEPSARISTPAGDDDHESILAESEEIRLQDAAHSAEPFQTIPLRGTYRGGADTFVRVQRWEDDTWRTFPVPARTDQAGAFTAYVELGQPRRYRLRVVDPQSGVTSEPFVLVIRR